MKKTRPVVVTSLERDVLAMAANIIGLDSVSEKCLKVADVPKGGIRSWWFKGLTIREKLTMSEVDECGSN